MRIAIPLLIALSLTPQPADFGAEGDEIVRLVREKFYDARTAEAWADKHAGYGEAIADGQQFASRTREILAELKASHTAFYTDRDVQFYGLSAIFGHLSERPAPEYPSIGADVTPAGFVRVVFAGGPADIAGLRRGDRVLKADGLPFQPVKSFEGRMGQAVELTVQRKAEEAPIFISVRARMVNAKKEWASAQASGTRIIRQGGKSIGYVPMFSCAGDEYQDLLQQSFSRELAEADALVIDFRNGWGGCSPGFINLFNRQTPVLTMIARNGQRSRSIAQWNKPLFVLINEGSKSGKEIVAYSVRKHKIGTLVGERTGGAVLAGRLFPVSYGNILYLATADVEVDGERLEGRGVEPDVEVRDMLEFANGRDPQLEKALELASR